MQTGSVDLLRALSDDRALAAQTLFSHEDETPAFHLELLSLWRSDAELVLIEAFRGSGKTTLASEFLGLEALFQNFRFAMLIADKEDKACEKLENLKYLITGRECRALFGKVLGGKDNAHVLVLANGVRIQAFGREQSPRGILFNVARPDRAFLDDVEKNEHVVSEESVNDTMKWVYAEVLPAMDRHRRKVRVAGTPLARDCMITRMRKDPNWLSRTYPIVSGDLDGDDALPLWPTRYPLHWVRKQRNMYAAQGMLTEFMQEFMCIAEEESEKPFAIEDLVEQPASPEGWIPKYAIYDPARTAKKSSNRTGKVVVSWAGSRLYVHESAGYFWKPSELIQNIFETHDKHAPIAIGVESDSLDEFLREPLRTEMVSRATSLPLVDLRAPKATSKEDFIKSLQPYSIAHDIVLVGGKVAHAQLVSELRKFPSKDVDVINALAYATRMRVGNPVYEDFGPDNVVDSPNVLHARAMYLAFNATLRETTCLAVQVDGQNFVVHDEWVIPGDMNDAAETIRMAANGIYARCRLLPFSPADLFDDGYKVPLVRALRSHGFQPARGAAVFDCRGALAPYIRTVIHGRRGLRVAGHCVDTLNAFSAGYAVAINSVGRPADEAVENHYRTLIEGLESLSFTLSEGVGSITQNAHYSTSPDGQRYITSRPGVRMR